MVFLRRSWPFLLLTVLSFSLHFAFLSYPAQVVFDETHFGKFVSAYFSGQYYFDIHPPLGKLLIAGFTKLNGLNPASFGFEHIGQAGAEKMFFILRSLPALFGSLFPLVLAWLAWLLTRSKKAALLAGFLALLDNALLIQSRVILVDIFLLFFEITAFCFFLLGLRQKTFDKKWFVYFSLTGLFSGLAVGVKWTGLAILGIFGVILLVKIFSPKTAEFLKKNDSSKKIVKTKESAIGFILIILVGFFIYLIPFAIHFKLLPHSGPGDAFMSPAFQQELKNPGPKSAFWPKFTELNQAMWKANAGLTQTHPYGSRWFSWPFDQKPIFYWNEERNSQSYQIFLEGNLFLWLLCFFVLIGTLLSVFLKKYRALLSPAFFILILSYLANLLPFIFIKRVSFLYHYLPALIYSLIILAVWLADLWPKQKKLFITILTLILINFILFLPMTFGWPAN